MQRTVRKFKRFRVDDVEDLKEYNEILDDPLCHITDRDVQVEETMHFDDEGKLSRKEKRTTFLVHWEEKII